MKPILAAFALLLFLLGCAPSGYRTPNEYSMAAYRRSVGLDRRTPLAAEQRVFAWLGRAMTVRQSEPLWVEYVLEANEVRGYYLLGEQEGRYGHLGTGYLRGSVRGDVLSLEVSRSQACVWTFTGVLTQARLQGRGLPTFCPGEEAFEWTLETVAP